MPQSVRRVGGLREGVGDRHLELQYRRRQGNGDDAVGRCEQALDARNVLIVVLCRHPQELRRWRTAAAVIGGGAARSIPSMGRRAM